MAMSGKCRQFWRLGTLSLALLGGCRSRQDVPADPLFEMRKPVEVKAKLMPPTNVAQQQITPPRRLHRPSTAPAMAYSSYMLTVSLGLTELYSITNRNE